MLGLALGLALLAAPPETLRLEDVFELEWASDPRISPDGERIVYVRNSMDIRTDRRRSTLWMVNADGTGHRPLTSGARNDASPRWAPDGARLLFVAGESDGPQIHLLWLEKLQSARLTQLVRPPADLAWSPDGRWIVFTMRVPDEKTPLVTLPKKPEGAEWAEPAKVIQKLLYRADGKGYLEEGTDQLFLLPADGGTPRRLTTGPFSHGGPVSFAPDGASLFLSANRRPDFERDPLDSEIFELSLPDGRLRQVTDRRGPDRRPVVAPDGARIAYLGFDDRRQGHQASLLHVLERDAAAATVLAQGLDRDIERAIWAADGRALYFQFDDRGSTSIARVSLTGQVETLVRDAGGTSFGRPYTGATFTVAQNGRIAYTRSRPERPADVAVLDPGQPQPRTLTALNDDLLADRTLGRLETVRFTSSFDGRPLEGWLVLPPGHRESEKHPLILEIHGGPFAAYGPHFSIEIQLFAARGYAVLYMNPRGSTSYGTEFANLIHHNYPGQDYDDLMSGVDAMIARGVADPGRLFVTGGSGGGVLTSWIIGKTDRFRAAVVAKPVINWISFALTSDNYNYYHQYWFPGFPWEVPEHYLARSPLSLVASMKTPTMLLTGEEDYRTPISESEQLYQALKLRGVDTALVRIPGASHGIATRPSHLMSKVAHILAWFARHDKER